MRSLPIPSLVGLALLGAFGMAVGAAQEGLFAGSPPPDNSRVVLELELGPAAVRDGVALAIDGVAMPDSQGQVRYEDAIEAIHAKAATLLRLSNSPEAVEALSAVLRITSERTLETGAVVVRAELDLDDAASLAAAYGQAVAGPRGDATNLPSMSVGPARREEPPLHRSADELLAQLRSDPENPALFNGLGLAYAASGRLQEALNAFSHAAELYGSDPRGAEPRYNLGALYYSDRRYGEALTQFKLALQLDPNYTLAHYGCATAYEALGESGQARAEYTAYLMTNPTGPLADAARQAMNRLAGPGTPPPGTNP